MAVGTKYSKVQIVSKDGKQIEITDEGKIKVVEENLNILNEILIQLKINNAYMREIVGEKLTELDTEK